MVEIDKESIKVVMEDEYQLDLELIPVQHARVISQILQVGAAIAPDIPTLFPLHYDYNNPTPAQAAIIQEMVSYTVCNHSIHIRYARLLGILLERVANLLNDLVELGVEPDVDPIDYIGYAYGVDWNKDTYDILMGYAELLKEF